MADISHTCLRCCTSHYLIGQCLRNTILIRYCDINRLDRLVLAGPPTSTTRGRTNYLATLLTAVGNLIQTRNKQVEIHVWVKNTLSSPYLSETSKKTDVHVFM